MHKQTPLTPAALSHIAKEDRIVLFGASGFIGSVLLQKLVQSSDSVCQEIILASRNPKKLRIAAEDTSQQRLIWTSTSAVDTIFARLSPKQQEVLQSEAVRLADHIAEVCKKDLGSHQVIEQHISEIVATLPFVSFPEKPGGKTVCFATEYSYAYTKYIGQLLLTRVPHKNIRILKISDVYGLGQDISEKILDPLAPARRAQRTQQHINKLGRVI